MNGLIRQVCFVFYENFFRSEKASILLQDDKTLWSCLQARLKRLRCKLFGENKNNIIFHFIDLIRRLGISYSRDNSVMFIRDPIELNPCDLDVELWIWGGAGSTANKSVRLYSHTWFELKSTWVRLVSICGV